MVERGRTGVGWRRGMGVAIVVALGLAASFLPAARAQVGNSLDDQHTPFGGVDGLIRGIAVAGDHVWVGGEFSAAYDVDSFTPVGRSNLARFDYNTGELVASSVGTDAPVYALAFDGVSTVFAGGQFTSVDGTPTPYLVALSAGTGQPLPGFASGANGAVHDLAFHEGWLYVAGEFTSWNNQSGTNLIRVDPATGERDTTFDPNPQDKVWDIAIHGSSIYAAGYFDGVGEWGDPTSRRWAAGFELGDGTVLDADLSLPARAPGEDGHKEEARAIHASTDGAHVFIGDDRNIIRSVGATDAQLRWGFESEGDIQAVAVQGDWLFVGNHQGWFEKFDGRILVALDAQTGNVRTEWTPVFDDGDTEGILTIANDDQTLLAGGQFATVNDTQVRHLAVFRSADWQPVEPLPMLGDVDCDGELSIIDALVLAQYDAGGRAVDACPAPESTTAISMSAADINRDRQVDGADARRVAECLMGLAAQVCG